MTLSVKRFSSFIRIHPRAATFSLLISEFCSFLAVYSAGAFAEAKINDGLAFLFGLLALLISCLSILFQALFWSSTDELRLGRLAISKPVMWIGLMMGASLLSFAVFAPIAFLNQTSFLYRARMIPAACLLLFVLLSGTVLLAVRRYGERKTALDAGEMFSRRHEPLLMPFLILYFILLTIPYICAPFPALNAFFTGSGKVPYRLITTGIFGAFSLYLWIKHKIKPRWDLLIPITLLAIGAVLASSFAPTSFVFVVSGLNRSFSFSSVSIGSSAALIDTFTLVAGCGVFFCLVSFFSKCIDSRRQVIWPIVSIVAVVALTCFYSYITEFNRYIAYLTGQDQTKGAIASMFHSKNSFGIYLFMGCFASAFLVFYIRRWPRYLFLVSYIVFLATGYIAQCNTAVVPSLIFGLIMLFLGISGIWKRNRAVGLMLFFSTLLILAIFVLCITVEPIYSQVKLFARFNGKLKYFMEHEMDTRVAKWSRCLAILTGPFSLIGKTETLSALQLSYYETAAGNMAYPDFHSSYVTVYSASGVCGLSFYLFCIGFAFKNISFFRIKGKRTQYVFLLLLLCTVLLWAMAETFVLFQSISVISLPASYIFLVASPFVTKEKTA